MQNTFYNDLRDPSAIDYSKPIFDWLESCKDEVSEKWKYIMSGELKKKQKELLGDVEVPCVPDFKVADMQKTHFTELCFRLGAGYIYCHQVMLFKSFYSSTCIQAIAYTLTKSSLILLWHRKSFTCILSYFLDFLCGCLRYNVVPPTIILGFLLLIMRSITRILLRIDQQISPSFL